MRHDTRRTKKLVLFWVDPCLNFIGPRAQDRIVALDAAYIIAMLLLVTFGIGSGRTVYFEAALVIGLLGFVSTVALAKFLMRGEVIE